MELVKVVFQNQETLVAVALEQDIIVVHTLALILQESRHLAHIEEVLEAFQVVPVLQKLHLLEEATLDQQISMWYWVLQKDQEIIMELCLKQNLRERQEDQYLVLGEDLKQKEKFIQHKEQDMRKISMARIHLVWVT